MGINPGVLWLCLGDLGHQLLVAPVPGLASQGLSLWDVKQKKNETVHLFTSKSGEVLALKKMFKKLRLHLLLSVI